MLSHDDEPMTSIELGDDSRPPSAVYAQVMVRAVNHQFIRVAVIGAGSWGTTVASLVAENTSTVLWARRADLADAMTQTRVNPDYLSDFLLPETLQFTSDMGLAVSDADVVVMAVPSHGFREVAAEVARFIRPTVPIVSLA